MQVRAAGFALLALLLPAAARADEIRLKDGTKITGAIVGYENDSFRVETSYGFALIRKDKVAEISISADKDKKDSESKSNAPAAAKSSAPSSPGLGAPLSSAGPGVAPAPTSGVSPRNTMPGPEGSAAPLSGTSPSSARAHELVPAVAKEPVSSAAKLVEPSAPPKDRAKSPATAAATAAKPDPATAKKLNGTAPAGPAATEPPARSAPKSSAVSPASSPAPDAAPATPPAPPEPPVIRDEIHGTEYANLTYGFHIYKPPSWDLIPDARKALPDAIAALGTFDETTLLVIGRANAKDSLEAHADATGKTLAGIYENYRLISNKHLTIAGFAAMEQRARGTAAGKDWSVVLVTFLKGNDAYTLLGMTWADSDLIQVQENVLTKSINSLTFTTQ